MKLTTCVEAQPCLRSDSRVSGYPPKNAQGRRILAALVLIFSASVVTPASAKDPCKTVLCMFGKLTGNSGGSECSSAEADYFGITVKKHGKINWGKTATARGQFLDSCPGADKGSNKKINDTFGKVMG
ncbi:MULTISPECIES: TrbM/KikA/MpfK family conjugal transfer protein [unclassified Pseudomonas]|uniref:TrbM/KikA/MpfK family conjugal transfer protein n=1 Tax=unclassified Pseudomonas TaxID=196821 RepID=UPI001F580C0B|nr:MULTISPECIES: TrbM/KikA/MpfK family conjugal transfer protein [unclassified Pseudomonas]